MYAGDTHMQEHFLPIAEGISRLCDEEVATNTPGNQEAPVSECQVRQARLQPRMEDPPQHQFCKFWYVLVPVLDSLTSLDSQYAC